MGLARDVATHIVGASSTAPYHSHNAVTPISTHNNLRKRTNCDPPVLVAVSIFQVSNPY